MNLQRTLLRAMLWMLGLSAGAGVLAVFLSTRVMGRVAGTAFIAAIAVGLAMPVSKWMDDEKRRTGGVIGLGAIVIAFVLAMGAVWAGLFWLGWDLEWRLVGSSVLACIGGLIAANMVSGRIAQRHWWARTVALYADLLAMGLLAGAIWTSYPLDSWLGQSGWLVLASGAVSALSLVGLGVESRPWRWLGVLASAAGLTLGLVGVWLNPSDDPTWYIACMSVGAAIAYAIVVLGIPMGEARGWACLISIGSVAATGICVSLLSSVTGGFDEGGPEILTKLAGAMGIVAACSTLGVVILYRLNRRTPEVTAAVTEIRAVQLACPHCGRRQSAPLGASSCGGCGLVITLKVDEPRCGKCGYPLLDLRGDVCPECGAPHPVPAR